MSRLKQRAAWLVAQDRCMVGTSCWRDLLARLMRGNRILNWSDK